MLLYFEGNDCKCGGKIIANTINDHKNIPRKRDPQKNKTNRLKL